MNLGTLEEAWLRRDTIYPESDYPVYERWGSILAIFPEARVRGLNGIYNDLYRQILNEGTGSRLIAAVELVNLQYRWFLDLLGNDVGRSHYCVYNLTALEVWRKRFMHRIETTMPDRFEEGEDEDERGRFIPAHDIDTRYTKSFSPEWRH